ncbi:MAG: YeeE/YedE family protein [Mesorhizobium sp.]|uniref:DUF6691 family protein n=1 Tax=Mesorhizobium sp. TaxID=1871066 RepID=UPI000FE911D3|nr:DUF6691 family protein [Mesorhizobium sp.]RWL94467.1 MAG: YeeE/YedE family protein [Mesorhizobium sp.]TIO47731.1 MAG: YeeE/YedE family protein [Mesorhizobium sp.]TIO56193.1 MAG: YeeE/YedE family protein [Mesorhizobium sp.]TJV57175.1 MAG: YeeE/YedE family protein [Mesorhizobium sp.]
MGKLVSAFVIGGLFGLGIAVSGMINPAKVLNFFDIAGTWDPSLVFVMGGGLAVAFVGYRLIFARRKRPVFESAFALPSKKDIDGQLVSGAALFGIGWGIAGFCPGGAIPALGLGRAETLIFVVAMIAGIAVARLARTRLARPAVT